MELAVGIIVLMPIVLVLFDLAIIVIAVQVNDHTCRQAARAAASGDPNSAAQRASAIVGRANQSGSGMLSNFVMDQCILTAGPNSPSGDVLNDVNNVLPPYGGTVSGTVTVETTVQVTPFVVPYVVQQGSSGFTFRSSQTFPFTFVVPNTAT